MANVKPPRREAMLDLARTALSYTSHGREAQYEGCQRSGSAQNDDSLDKFGSPSMTPPFAASKKLTESMAPNDFQDRSIEETDEFQKMVQPRRHKSKGMRKQAKPKAPRCWSFAPATPLRRLRSWMRCSRNRTLDACLRDSAPSSFIQVSLTAFKIAHKR